MFDVIIPTPIGYLGIKCEETKITSVRYLEQSIIPLPSVKQPLHVRKIASSIETFFHEPTCLKHLDLSLKGSPFQKKVWRALHRIPLGKTLTYGELANKLNTSARAVGMACRTNPVALVVPCHRVVAAKHVGGFCGATQGSKIAIKEWLLAHERAFC